MASRKQGVWEVPGYGLPLRWQQNNDNPDVWVQHDNNFLYSALDGSEEGGCGTALLTVRELRMIFLMNQLTDTHQWDQKVFWNTFVDEWKRDTLQGDADVTSQMVDWCIEEVRDIAHDFQYSKIIPALDRGVNKSDTLLSPTLKAEFLAAVALLDREPSVIYIKRTNFDKILTNIVDPSLYPFICRTTKVVRYDFVGLDECIEWCNKGAKKIYMEHISESKLIGKGCYANEKAWSRQYQWLPCEVKFDDKHGDLPSIDSYINDVNPSLFGGFYNTIEKILNVTIPLFNRSLLYLKTSGLFKPRIPAIVRGGEAQRGSVEPGPYRNAELRAFPKYVDKHSHLKSSVFVDLHKEFWDIGIQIIIKVSSIELTPERPEYAGEPWHVQGQLNERICATVLYFYDCKNVDESSLSFRQRVYQGAVQLINLPAETNGISVVDLSAENRAFTEKTFGIQNLAPSVQDRGSVKIREDRVISFPNSFQLKMNPIRLADFTQSGHVKYLTIHLVDPNRRIMSTANVPCQRRDWWAREIRERVEAFKKLPLELFDIIIGMVDDFLLSLEAGRIHRDDFVAEREVLEKHTEAMMKVKFDLGRVPRRVR